MISDFSCLKTLFPVHITIINCRRLSNPRRLYFMFFFHDPYLQEAVDIFLKVEDFWKKHPVEEGDEEEKKAK